MKGSREERPTPVPRDDEADPHIADEEKEFCGWGEGGLPPDVETNGGTGWKTDERILRSPIIRCTLHLWPYLALRCRNQRVLKGSTTLGHVIKW